MIDPCYPSCIKPQERTNDRRTLEPLDPLAVLRGLGASPFAGNLIFHVTLDSTHRLAKELALQGAPEGTLILTEEQSAGRGRKGRTWHSPRYANLLLSLLLRPGLEAGDMFSLTMALGLAAVDGAEEVTGVHAKIKWPNDLFVAHKKLGGLLMEFSARGGKVEYAILSLGLNVGWNPAAEMSPVYPATSLLAETGRDVSRTRLLVAILRRFEEYYGRVRAGETEGLRRRWEEASAILGRQVVVEGEGERLEGTASRVERDGTLVVLSEDGRERRIRWGDVSLRLGD